MSNVKIIFDVAYLYYLPHFTPVIEQLLKDTSQESIEIHILFYDSPPNAIQQYFDANNIQTSITNEQNALYFYQQHQPDWVIFGHASDLAEELNGFTKTALILHGLGPKSTYYNASSKSIQYRFVESEERCKKLQQLYPDKTFITTGYTKLDPLVNDEIKKLDLTKLGLDPKKKTLLYAPTFYPSTIENFPKDWPKSFGQYNILLKPHYLSLVKSAYKNQRKLLEHWSTFDNVYLAKLEEQSLLPFMHTADIMISETSSALFEFMALNKPVIVCHFLKLRWGYRGLLKFRLNKRLSDDYVLFNQIGSNIDKFKDLSDAINLNIKNPEIYQQQRIDLIQQIVGDVDGKSSLRVKNYLLENA